MKNYSAQIGADIAGLQLQWLCPTTAPLKSASGLDTGSSERKIRPDSRTDGVHVKVALGLGLHDLSVPPLGPRMEHDPSAGLCWEVYVGLAAAS